MGKPTKSRMPARSKGEEREYVREARSQKQAQYVNPTLSKKIIQQALEQQREAEEEDRQSAPSQAPNALLAPDSDDDESEEEMHADYYEADMVRIR